MIYVFDIDNTICKTDNGNYLEAKPYPKRVAIINELFRNGHQIKLFTARGSETGIDWREFTENQLREWGLNYTILELGKPHGDIYIDDKAISDTEFFNDTSTHR